jgi:inorganic triphosphatase YgiF
LIDIAVYDEQYKPHVIKDVLINDQEAMSVVQTNFTFPVKAVMLNHGDYAYAKIRYDKHTLTNLKNDFQHVEDLLEHQMLWNHLFYHVMDNKISSVEYFNFIISQVPNEQSQGVVLDVLKSLQTDIDLFLPVSKVHDARKAQFNTLLKMMIKENNKEMKDILASHLFAAIQLDEHVLQAQQWLNKNQIFLTDKTDN